MIYVGSSGQTDKYLWYGVEWPGWCVLGDVGLGTGMTDYRSCTHAPEQCAVIRCNNYYANAFTGVSVVGWYF